MHTGFPKNSFRPYALDLYGLLFRKMDQDALNTALASLGRNNIHEQQTLEGKSTIWGSWDHDFRRNQARLRFKQKRFLVQRQHAAWKQALFLVNICRAEVFCFHFCVVDIRNSWLSIRANNFRLASLCSSNCHWRSDSSTHSLPLNINLTFPINCCRFALSRNQFKRGGSNLAWISYGG